MPQLFQVLRCYKCLVFQVHQTKKSIKWECKLCGETQSHKRHYGLGTAKDCRMHVQKLNSMRGDIEELKNNQDSENSDNENNVTTIRNATFQPIKDSIWSNYIEETEAIEENSNENMSLGDAEVVLEIPKKRRKQYNLKRNPKEIKTVDYKKIQVNHDNDDALNVAPIAFCNNVSIQSITSQPNLITAELTAKEKGLGISKSTIKKKFIPPVLNKNSKWTQFADDAADSEETEITSSPSKGISQKDLLFSLCDDSDLDNVLNI